MKPVEIHAAALSLARCTGWRDLVRPALERHLRKYRDHLLTAAATTPESLAQARLKYDALKDVLRDLKSDTSRAWKDLPAGEKVLHDATESSVLERLFDLEDSHSPAPPASEAEPQTKDLFNPFAARFTPSEEPPPPTTST